MTNENTNENLQPNDAKSAKRLNKFGELNDIWKLPLDVSLIDRALLTVLCLRRNEKEGGRLYASTEKLAQNLNISERAVRDHRDWLIKMGYLKMWREDGRTGRFKVGESYCYALNIPHYTKDNPAPARPKKMGKRKSGKGLLMESRSIENGAPLPPTGYTTTETSQQHRLIKQPQINRVLPSNPNPNPQTTLIGKRDLTLRPFSERFAERFASEYPKSVNVKKIMPTIESIFYEVAEQERERLAQAIIDGVYRWIPYWQQRHSDIDENDPDEWRRYVTNPLTWLGSMSWNKPTPPSQAEIYAKADEVCEILKQSEDDDGEVDFTVFWPSVDKKYSDEEIRRGAQRYGYDPASVFEQRKVAYERLAIRDIIMNLKRTRVSPYGDYGYNISIREFWEKAAGKASDISIMKELKKVGYDVDRFMALKEEMTSAEPPAKRFA